MRHLSWLAGEHADHLHRLAAEWQLLSDLSFADLLLWIPRDTPSGPAYVCIAQMRPSTGPTLYQDDLVGMGADAEDRAIVARAFATGSILRDTDPDWRDDTPVREEAIPVRAGIDGPVVAVITRETNLATARTPSQLELAYLAAASDLALMVSEGTFPFERVSADLLMAPRVGDGMLRLDADGLITFASPNALSAYLRLGLRGNLVGRNLADVHGSLTLSGEDVLDGPPLPGTVTGGRVDRVLVTRAPLEGEIEGRDGSTLFLRALPLLPGRAVLGAIVLVRDTTELRRRDRQLLTKDATIREIHHRVKNNLQTVAALLRLQARRASAPEVTSALTEATRRVTSIALVHETLSQTLTEAVAFDSIADQLASASLDVATVREGPRAGYRREGSFGVLPADVATPLALVISELVQNAVEHAFGGSDAGNVRLTVRRGAAVGGGIEVVVSDDGAGLPEGFSLEKATGLGLQIVKALAVGELRATVALRPGADGGTEAVVAVPASRLLELSG